MYYVGVDYGWSSRLSLDFNLGFEVGEGDGMREDVMYGRLLLFYFGVFVNFFDLSVILV